MNDEEIENYVSKSLTEEYIRNAEDELLRLMKIRQDHFPSEINDKEWLAFTNFVCRRRCQRTAEMEYK